MAKKKFKKPNIILWKLFYWISKFICKFKLKLRIIKNELKKVKGPYVVIANHQASIDFMPMCVAVKRRAHIVISKSFYESLSVQPFIRAIGAIPKNQFQTLIPDMKRMKSVLDNGMPLIIYPAGLMTESGIHTPVPSATGKTLKWFGKDVYFADIRGSYFAKPKWGKGIRKGRVTLSVTKLIDSEALKQISEEELQKIVEEKLSYDAYEDQMKNRIPFKNGDNVEGFEYVLYKCPKCHQEHTIKVVNKNQMVCDCGYNVTFDKCGLMNGENLIFDTPSNWYRSIEKDQFDVVFNTPNYELSDEAEIHKVNLKKHKFESVGTAVVKLTQEGFNINGNINGEVVDKFISTKYIQILPFKPGKFLEIQDGNEIYRILLKKNKDVTKWLITLKAFYELNNPKK